MIGTSLVKELKSSFALLKLLRALNTAQKMQETPDLVIFTEKNP